MASGDLAKLTTLLSTRLAQSSATYRKEIANKQTHFITINEKDIKNQIREEMRERGAVGPGGKLAKRIEDIIDDEVPIMCTKIYNAAKSYNDSGLKKTAVSKIKGSAKSFTFIIAQSADKGNASVFNAFRTMKGRSQKKLLAKIKAAIVVLNKGRTASVIAMPSSNFLDIGHDNSSAIANQKVKDSNAALFQFGTTLSSGAQKELKNLVSSLGINITSDTRKEPRVLSVSIESSRLNKLKGSQEEKQIVVQLNKDLETLLAALGGEYWLNQESSDSKKTQIIKSVLNPFAKKAKKNKRMKVNFTEAKIIVGASKAKGKKKKPGVSRGKPFVDKSNGSVGTLDTNNRSSMFSLVALLNRDLPATVKKNMGFPRMDNVSGTFANSVRVENVIPTKGGFPSFGYTYQSDPYEVFEDGGRGSSPWADGKRDPRKLIDASIREIARSMAIGRFYTRRL